MRCARCVGAWRYGHLIHADQTNWLPRARVILLNDPTQAFPPFDRYAMLETSRGTSMSDLLDAFARVRQSSLTSLRGLNLSPADLDAQGTHPQFGPVTLRQLLAAWTVHDLGRTHQIAKAMAFQYREEVGAWREYLTILPRGS